MGVQWISIIYVFRSNLSLNTLRVLWQFQKWFLRLLSQLFQVLTSTDVCVVKVFPITNQTIQCYNLILNGAHMSSGIKGSRWANTLLFTHELFSVSEPMKEIFVWLIWGKNFCINIVVVFPCYIKYHTALHLIHWDKNYQIKVQLAKLLQINSALKISHSHTFEYFKNTKNKSWRKSYPDSYLTACSRGISVMKATNKLK